MSRWALPASLGLHCVIAALVIFGLPVALPQPAKEQAIKVDLVPPPEAPKAEKAKPAAPPERAKAKKPPAPKKPRPEKTPPARAETPPQLADATRRSPFPVMRPVVQFGEKNAGPRKSLDGDSVKDGGAPAKTAAEAPTAAKKSPPDPLPDDANPLGANLLTSSTGKFKPATAKPKAEDRSDAPKPEAPNPKTERGPKLHEAKRLYSRAATGDLVATTAMGRLPRGERAGELCLTELRDQLLNASPPFFPQLLPSYRLSQGTVLEVREGAFLANAQWFNLSFRCKIDPDATRVESFAFNVGRPIPRSEWKRRHLPSQ